MLGEVPGGNYENILPETILVNVYNQKICCVNLEKLIFLKKASGRPKDFEAIAELELILKKQNE